MSARGWLPKLEGADPSVPLALAALVGAADLEGRAGLDALLLGYREGYLRVYRPAEGLADSVREHVASSVLPPGIIDALIGVLIGGGVLWLIGEAYFRYSGHEGMGGGDVKMLAMIGAFLGWKLVLVTLVLSSVLGSIIGLIVILGGVAIASRAKKTPAPVAQPAMARAS